MSFISKITKKINKRSKVYTEQFACKVDVDLKDMERKLHQFGWDVPELSRQALKEAFESALTFEVDPNRSSESEAS